MRKIILLLIPLLFGILSYGQRLTYSEIDSIVASINTKPFASILDTGRVFQGELSGRYRESYIIDTTTNELRGYIESVKIDKTFRTTLTAFYFYKSKLIKVEITDVNSAGKKYNTTYLYYVDGRPENDSKFQNTELRKLKYLRLSSRHLENFKKKFSKQ